MKKILIIRLTSLGDVIFTLPLACNLKNGEDDIEIGWVVAEKGLEVVMDNPCIDKHFLVPLKQWKKHPFSLKNIIEFFKIINAIRKEKYDIAIDCQQMFKSLLLFWLCGAKKRITFKDARELSILGGNEFVKPKAHFRDNNYHIVERNLDFARHLGRPVNKIEFSVPDTSPVSKDKIDVLIKYLDASKPNVIISPATTWANKHWSERNWAETIDAICEKCNIIFTGTNADEQLIERILAKTKGKICYVNLVGKTNVDELRELFLRSKVVISPDSGSAHLAWASGVPAVVTIFTCTPSKRFGPYGEDGKYFSVTSNLPCQPCFKNKCQLKKNKNQCQDYPNSSEIINIVNQLLL